MSAFPPKLPWNELYVRSGLKTLSDRVRQRPLVRRVRGAVDDVRTTVRNVARQRLPDTTAVVERLARRVLNDGDVGPSTIINATGVIAPRGLALPLADSAIAAMNAVAVGYSMPTAATERLLCELTGAEAALVLHSSAIASLAVLGTLGGPITVARDQVRMLDTVSLADSAAFVGASLVEIGTVGRVSLDDYRADFSTAGEGCLWYEQPQSISVTGDVAAPLAEEVFALAHDQRCPVVEYFEAATLVDLSCHLGGSSVPIVGASLLAGADLAIFPGDRYIGGPACGIVVGRSELIAQVAAHPLARASAANSVQLAALAATLQLNGQREQALSIPVRQLLAASAENLQHRAERIASQLSACRDVMAAEPLPCAGYLDDGRLPSRQIPGWGVAITANSGSVETIVQSLRKSPHGLAVSVENGRAVINLRSVLARQDEQVIAAFQGQN